jgi:hypothetical protein
LFLPKPKGLGYLIVAGLEESKSKSNGKGKTTAKENAEAQRTRRNTTLK